MAFKIVLLLSLLGSAFAPPTSYAPPRQRDSNIIIGSSVSGPRTFDDPAAPLPESSPSVSPADFTVSNSGAFDQTFSQSSGPSNSGSVSQGFSIQGQTQESTTDGRPVSGPVGVNPSVGSSVSLNSGSFPGFGPFGGLGSASTGNVLFSGVAGGNLGSQNLPSYEEHVLPRAGPLPTTQTITNQVTKTHTLRVPVTSDVWVTSVTMVTVPVTQLSTQRRYVPGVAGTVTSVVRITRTPVSVLTRTVEIFPAKTMVSVFTTFQTSTRSVEFWQPIVHIATNYEVMTVPVLQTQTLLQRVFTTVTVTRSVDVTSTRQFFTPRSGPLSFRPSRAHQY